MLSATITKIQQAFEEIKHMHCNTWEGDHLLAARDALKEILEFCMANAIDAHLEQKRTQGFPDCRNGSCPRHLLTELGDLGLRIPRTRIFNVRVLLKRFASCLPNMFVPKLSNKPTTVHSQGVTNDKRGGI